MAAENLPFSGPRSGLGRREIEDYIASRPAVEWKIARSVVRRAGLAGPILIVVATLLRGVDGLIASTIGMMIVAGYYAFNGAMLSAAARISLAAYHAIALFGFFIRLGLITVTMVVLTRVFELDKLVLGFTVITAYVGLLTWEAVAMGSARRTGVAKRV